MNIYNNTTVQFDNHNKETVMRAGVALKTNVFNMHTKCVQTHVNFHNMSPVLASAV